MPQNFIRSCALTVSGGTSGSKTISGGGNTDLRIVFSIEASTVQSPNMAHFRVYNPSQSTVTALLAKEFTKVSFSGGYQGNTGLIYTGDLIQSTYGHEQNNVDSYVDIYCGGGNAAYESSHLNKTLAAGYTPNDLLNTALAAFAPFGVALGLTNVDLSQPSASRGTPLSGMTRDLMRRIGLSHNALWSIQNNDSLHLIDHTKPASSGSPIVLNSATGMISWPKQTQDGIVVESLMSAKLQPNVLVQINESSIIPAEPDYNPITGPGSQQNLNLANTGAISPNGIYWVLFMTRRGDSRGADWTDTCTCLATTGGPDGNGAATNQSEVDAGYLGSN